MIEKLINKKRKEYAIFLNENGEQQDIIKLNRSKNSFNYKNGKYIKNKDIFNYITIGFNTYYLYNFKSSIPLIITNDINNKYVAEQIYSIVETNILKDINRLENSLFNGLDSKKIILIGCIVIGFLYYILGGF